MSEMAILQQQGILSVGCFCQTRALEKFFSEVMQCPVVHSRQSTARNRRVSLHCGLQMFLERPISASRINLNYGGNQIADHWSLFHSTLECHHDLGPSGAKIQRSAAYANRQNIGLWAIRNPDSVGSRSYGCRLQGVRSKDKPTCCD
jgi:hypothetical protein